MKKNLLTLLAITLMIATTIQAQIPTNGLVAYYPFSGNANDVSGNGNNGTVNGAILTTDRFGKTNSAYNFINNTDKITIPLAQANLTGYTVSGWFKKQSGNGGTFFVGSNFSTLTHGLLLAMDNSYQIAFGAEFGTNSVWSYSDGSKFLDNNWHFFCAVYQATSGSVIDTGNLTLSIDNVKLSKVKKVWGDSLRVISPVDNNGNITVLGNYTYNPTGSFHGVLDDIAIYNRALNSAEVNTLYHDGGYATNGIPTNGLIAWYPFTGNALDSSGNNNHGTNNGANLSTDRFGKASSAYSFNGTSNYISFPQTFIFNKLGDGTVSIWLKNDSIISQIYSTFIYSRTTSNADLNRFNFYLQPLSSNKNIRLTIDYRDSVNTLHILDTSNSIINHDWNNMIISRSGSTYSFYLNGELACKKTDSNINLPNQIGWLIGKNACVSRNFKGNLDDIRIYNRALDSTEVKVLYHEGGYDTATNGIPKNGLVAWYPFSGNAVDSSGNGHNGNISNSSFGVDRFGKANQSAYFDNTSISEFVSSNIGNHDTLTFAFWYKCNIQSKYYPTFIDYGSTNTSVTNSRYIMHMAGDEPTWINTLSGKVYNQTNLGGVGIFDTTKTADNSWHQMVNMYVPNDSIYLYVDGVKIGAQSFKKASITDGTIYFGRDITDNAGACSACGRYLGYLDDIRIYNHKLNTSEVQALYHEGGYDTATNGIPKNGLVAWYPFTGNTLDSSGNNNHGTNSGATLTTDRFGRVNSAYGFSSNNNIICTKDSFNNPQTFSYSVWFKSTNDGLIMGFNNTQCGIIQVWDRYLVIKPTGELDFRIYLGSGLSKSCTSKKQYLDGKWHNVVCQLSPSGMQLYVDGEMSSQDKSALKADFYTGYWRVGGDIAATTAYTMRGNVDDIRIYNRPLDSTEVKALYHEGGYDTATNGIPKNGLVAWYPFTGNALDSSGNNNHGTNNGATLTTDRFGNSNNAYSFDGSKSYIRCLKPGPLGSASRSLSVWINSTDSTTDGSVISYGNNDISSQDFRVRHANTNCHGVSCTSNGAEKVGISNFSTTWKHYVIIYDSIKSSNLSGVSIFENGKLISNYCNSGNNSGLNTGNGNPITIGCYHWLKYSGNLNFFKGKLDDIRFYNRSLDSTEIQALYHEGGYTGTTLPVSLANFAASKSSNYVQVNWLTATELNTSHFIIQHGIDGKSFTNIGIVNAIGNGANNYDFTDKSPINGTNYYRLQSIDKDGAISYSKVVSVQFANGSNRFSVYPNPAKNVLTIAGEHITKVQVLDNMGRVVNTQSLHDAKNPLISVDRLTSGVYHLRIQTTDGNSNTLGFIKQ